jgi:hypothetical protein
LILLRVLGAGGVAGIFLLVNGGYVYRTKCPLPSGGTQTNWAYRINDVLPYIGRTSAPCKSHTGTRLALSAAGLWPVHDGFSASSTHVTPEDKAAANGLAQATAAINVEYERERKLGAKLNNEVKAHGGFTPATRSKFFRVGETGAAAFTAIKTSLDRSVHAKDAELAETQQVLSVWLARQIEIDRVLLTSKTTAEFKTRTEKVARKIAPLVRRLQALAADVQAKYPNVKNWAFLPNA